MSNMKGECTRLLVVDDDPGMHTLVHDLFANESTKILSASTLAEGLLIANRQRIDVVLLDHLLPDGQGIDRILDFLAQDRLRPILYITAQAGSKTAIDAMKRGAFEYLSKPIDFNLLGQRIEEAVEYRRLTRVPVLVDNSLNHPCESDILVGRCRGMQEVYKCIGRFSNLRSPVLIEGEVGTGKEMVARAIHQNGDLASGPFRKVSSKEFDEADLQCELFGGNWPLPASPDSIANKLPALLECTGGTLMIDDIDSWSIASQSRLLRFFQSQTIDGVPANTRVILATSLKIRDLVQSGIIRNDLFYFVSPFVIRIPALRDRQEDLELLVCHFMQRIANVSSTQTGQGPPRVSSAAFKLLKDYDWPGNIAELKSVLQGVLTDSRGAVLATDALIRFLNDGLANPSHADVPLNFPPPIARPASKKQTDVTPADWMAPWNLRAFVEEQVATGTDRLYDQAISLLDQQLLQLVMQHTQGNRAKAAKILGITRTSLRRKMNGGFQPDAEGTSPEQPKPDVENA